MKNSLIAGSVVILGLLLGQAAHADASASVTVNNIKFYVIDMDLNDGEIATINFVAMAGQNASTWASANGQIDWGVRDALPSAVNHSYLGASGWASTVGGGSLDSFTMMAQANSSNGASAGGGHISLNFTLSKNAMLVLSVDTSVSVATTIGVASSGQQIAYSVGQVGLQSWEQLTGIGSSGFFQAGTWSDSAAQITKSGSALAAFHNTSGADFKLVGNVYAEARVEVPLAPVPEPETYAMLLAGLGVLGLLQRRRRA